jgi:hypothetical protein
MTTFLLSVGETGPRIGNMVASTFFSVSFLYTFFFSFLKLPVGVSGSVPEREHDHLFALCRRGLVPDREHGRLFALCRRVGLGAFFSVSFFLIYLAFSCLFQRVGLGP